jgi:hypothetical protein
MIRGSVRSRRRIQSSEEKKRQQEAQAAEANKRVVEAHYQKEMERKAKHVQDEKRRRKQIWLRADADHVHPQRDADHVHPQRIPYKQGFPAGQPSSLGTNKA